jgi:hypothetical protein
MARSVSSASARRVGLLAGGLRHPGRAGQDAAGTDVGVHEVNAPVGNQELADLVRVRHAARLDHVEHAVAFAVAFEILQQQPRVHERGHGDFTLLQRVAAVRQAGEERGDLSALQIIDQPRHHPLVSESVPAASRLVIGSTMTTWG